MARLEFTIDNRVVIVDNVDPEDSGVVVSSLVKAFDDMAQERAKQHAAIRESFTIPSASHPGTVHVVRHYGNGVMDCDCLGFNHRHYCRHIQAALDQIRARH